MSIFLILLSFIVGLIILNKDNIVVTIFLIILIVFFLFRHKFKFKIIIPSLLIFLALGILIANLKIDFDNPNVILGFVTKKNENYVIVSTLSRKYYIYNPSNLNLFDLVKIEGYRKEINFSTYESSFDFGKYLKQSGVSNQFVIIKEEVVFESLIPFSAYQNFVLSRFNNQTLRSYAASLLFSSKDDFVRSQETSSIFSLLFNVSGILINSLLYFVKRLFDKFVDKKNSRLLTIIVLIPVLLFNIYKFSTLKAIIFFIFDSVTANKEYSKIGKKSFLYLMFLLIDHNLIYSFSFLLSIVFSIFFIVGKLFLYSENLMIKNIKNKVLVMLIFLPFYIKMNNSLNFINLIINVTFAGFFKFLYGFLALYIYGIKLTFAENFIVKIIGLVNKIDFNGLDIYVPEFSTAGYILYFLCLTIILYFGEIRFYSKIFKYCLIGVMSLIVYSIPIENLLSYEVSFINVGQGDCTLIRLKQETYLIDTGGILSYDLATQSIIPFLKKNRIYRIDGVFITHYDFDHYGSLESLKNNFLIKNVYDYNSSFPIKNKEVTFENLNSYRTVDSEENDKSLVIYSEIRGKEFLFMGDATIKIENNIMKDYKLDIDILKLGHHGSDTSSSYDFLKYIHPKVAIISCGKNNKYHHPSLSTLQSLNKLGIPYRRTDEEGTITYKFYSI